MLQMSFEDATKQFADMAGQVADKITKVASPTGSGAPDITAGNLTEAVNKMLESGKSLLTGSKELVSLKVGDNSYSFSVKDNRDLLTRATALFDSQVKGQGGEALGGLGELISKAIKQFLSPDGAKQASGAITQNMGDGSVGINNGTIDNSTNINMGGAAEKPESVLDMTYRRRIEHELAIEARGGPAGYMAGLRAQNLALEHEQLRPKTEYLDALKAPPTYVVMMPQAQAQAQAQAQGAPDQDMGAPAAGNNMQALVAQAGTMSTMIPAAVHAGTNPMGNLVPAAANMVAEVEKGAGKGGLGG